MPVDKRSNLLRVADFGNEVGQSPRFRCVVGLFSLVVLITRVCRRPTGNIPICQPVTVDLSTEDQSQLGSNRLKIGFHPHRGLCSPGSHSLVVADGSCARDDPWFASKRSLQCVSRSLVICTAPSHCLPSGFANGKM